MCENVKNDPKSSKTTYLQRSKRSGILVKEIHKEKKRISIKSGQSDLSPKYLEEHENTSSPLEYTIKKVNKCGNGSK